MVIFCWPVTGEQWGDAAAAAAELILVYPHVFNHLPSSFFCVREEHFDTSCWYWIVNNLSENLCSQGQVFGEVIFVIEVLIPLDSLEGKGDLHRWALMLILAFHGLSSCQITQLKFAPYMLSLFLELPFSPAYFQRALEVLKIRIRGTWNISISCLDCKLFHGH